MTLSTIGHIMLSVPLFAAIGYFLYNAFWVEWRQKGNKTPALVLLTIIYMLIGFILHEAKAQDVVSPPVLKTEKDFVLAFCTEGTIEHRLWDGSRVDCLMEEEAQEFDFGKKYHEAIGQALWYAMNTGTTATIVLIILDGSDEKGAMRARRIVKHYNLPVNIKLIRPSVTS